MKINNISKSFGDKIVLSNFSLELPESGIVAFMGPSGCGKTTLLRIITGLTKPDGGEIISNHTKLSIVFQEDRLLTGVTVFENMLAVLDKKNKPLSKKIALEWLDKVGLADDLKFLPEELSGGMRRRLAFARALSYGGDLLILDEPFAGLDTATRESIYPYIDRNRKTRLTILITHDQQEAEQLADKVFHFTGPPLAKQIYQV